MTWWKADLKLREDEARRTVRCSCSHVVVFSAKTEKVICHWCGRYIYNTNERGQKAKFRDTLKKTLNQIKREEKDNSTKITK